MENFAKFRNWLLVGGITATLTLGGYIWNGHVSAEATAQVEINKELKLLREIVIRLDAVAEHQKELNEWFVTEHIGTNRSRNR